MAKLTSADIKKLIVAHVVRNEMDLANEFEPAEDMGPAQIAKNWKRRGKYINTARRETGEAKRVYVREFNCDPYDDQLRAYVETPCPEDDEILHLEVVGE